MTDVTRPRHFLKDQTFDFKEGSTSTDEFNLLTTQMYTQSTILQGDQVAGTFYVPAAIPLSNRDTLQTTLEKGTIRIVNYNASLSKYFGPGIGSTKQKTINGVPAQMPFDYDGDYYGYKADGYSKTGFSVGPSEYRVDGNKIEYRDYETDGTPPSWGASGVSAQDVGQAAFDGMVEYINFFRSHNGAPKDAKLTASGLVLNDFTDVRPSTEVDLRASVDAQGSGPIAFGGHFLDSTGNAVSQPIDAASGLPIFVDFVTGLSFVVDPSTSQQKLVKLPAGISYRHDFRDALKTINGKGDLTQCLFTLARNGFFESASEVDIINGYVEFATAADALKFVDLLFGVGEENFLPTSLEDKDTGGNLKINTVDPAEYLGPKGQGCFHYYYYEGDSEKTTDNVMWSLGVYRDVKYAIENPIETTYDYQSKVQVSEVERRLPEKYFKYVPLLINVANEVPGKISQPEPFMDAENPYMTETDQARVHYFEGTGQDSEMQRFALPNGWRLPTPEELAYFLESQKNFAGYTFGTTDANGGRVANDSFVMGQTLNGNPLPVMQIWMIDQESGGDDQPNKQDRPVELKFTMTHEQAVQFLTLVGAAEPEMNPTDPTGQSNIYSLMRSRQQMGDESVQGTLGLQGYRYVPDANGLKQAKAEVSKFLDDKGIKRDATLLEALNVDWNIIETWWYDEDFASFADPVKAFADYYEGLGNATGLQDHLVMPDGTEVVDKTVMDWLLLEAMIDMLLKNDLERAAKLSVYVSDSEAYTTDIKGETKKQLWISIGLAALQMFGMAWMQERFINKSMDSQALAGSAGKKADDYLKEYGDDLTDKVAKKENKKTGRKNDTGIIGREKEAAAIAMGLISRDGKPGNVALTGPAGAGKTAAVEYLAELINLASMDLEAAKSDLAKAELELQRTYLVQARADLVQAEQELRQARSESKVKEAQKKVDAAKYKVTAPDRVRAAQEQVDRIAQARKIIPPALRNARIFEIDNEKMKAGAVYHGQQDARYVGVTDAAVNLREGKKMPAKGLWGSIKVAAGNFKNVQDFNAWLTQIENDALKTKSKVILFIDEAHMAKDFLEALKKATGRGVINVIIASTDAEIVEIFKDPAKKRRFVEVPILEADKDVIVPIMQGEVERTINTLKTGDPKTTPDWFLNLLESDMGALRDVNSTFYQELYRLAPYYYEGARPACTDSMAADFIKTLYSEWNKKPAVAELSSLYEAEVDAVFAEMQAKWGNPKLHRLDQRVLRDFRTMAISGWWNAVPGAAFFSGYRAKLSEVWGEEVAVKIEAINQKYKQELQDRIDRRRSELELQSVDPARGGYIDPYDVASQVDMEFAEAARRVENLGNPPDEVRRLGQLKKLREGEITRGLTPDEIDARLYEEGLSVKLDLTPERLQAYLANKPILAVHDINKRTDVKLKEWEKKYGLSQDSYGYSTEFHDPKTSPVDFEAEIIRARNNEMMVEWIDSYLSQGQQVQGQVHGQGNFLNEPPVPGGKITRQEMINTFLRQIFGKEGKGTATSHEFGLFQGQLGGEDAAKIAARTEEVEKAREAERQKLAERGHSDEFLKRYEGYIDRLNLSADEKLRLKEYLRELCSLKLGEALPDLGARVSNYNRKATDLFSDWFQLRQEYDDLASGPKNAEAKRRMTEIKTAMEAQSRVIHDTILATWRAAPALPSPAAPPAGATPAGRSPVATPPGTAAPVDDIDLNLWENIDPRVVEILEDSDFKPEEITIIDENPEIKSRVEAAANDPRITEESLRAVFDAARICNDAYADFTNFDLTRAHYEQLRARGVSRETAVKFLAIFPNPNSSPRQQAITKGTEANLTKAVDTVIAAKSGSERAREFAEREGTSSFLGTGQFSVTPAGEVIIGNKAVAGVDVADVKSTPLVDEIVALEMQGLTNEQILQEIYDKRGAMDHDRAGMILDDVAKANATAAQKTATAERTARQTLPKTNLSDVFNVSGLDGLSRAEVSAQIDARWAEVAGKHGLGALEPSYKAAVMELWLGEWQSTNLDFKTIEELNRYRGQLIEAKVNGLAPAEFIDSRLKFTEAVAAYKGFPKDKLARSAPKLVTHVPSQGMMAFWIIGESILRVSKEPNFIYMDSMSQFLAIAGASGQGIVGAAEFVAVDMAFKKISMEGITVGAQKYFAHFGSKNGARATSVFLSESLAVKGFMHTGPMVAASALFAINAYVMDDALHHKMNQYAETGNPTLIEIQEHMAMEKAAEFAGVELPALLLSIPLGMLGEGLAATAIAGTPAAGATLLGVPLLPAAAGIAVGLGGMYLASEVLAEDYHHYKKIETEAQYAMAIVEEVQRQGGKTSFHINHTADSSDWLEARKSEDYLNDANWRMHFDALLLMQKPLNTVPEFDKMLDGIADADFDAAQRLAAVAGMNLAQALTALGVTDITMTTADFNIDTIFGLMIAAAKHAGPKTLTLERGAVKPLRGVGMQVLYRVSVAVTAGTEAGLYNEIIIQHIPEAAAQLAAEEAPSAVTANDVMSGDLVDVQRLLDAQAKSGNPITLDYTGVDRLLFDGEKPRAFLPNLVDKLGLWSFFDQWKSSDYALKMADLTLWTMASKERDLLVRAVLVQLKEFAEVGETELTTDILKAAFADAASNKSKVQTRDETNAYVKAGLTELEKAWSGFAADYQPTLKKLTTAIMPENEVGSLQDRYKLITLMIDFVKARPDLAKALVAYYGIDWDFISTIPQAEFGRLPELVGSNFYHITWDDRVMDFVHAVVEQNNNLGEVVAEYRAALTQNDGELVSDIHTTMVEIGYTAYADELGKMAGHRLESNSFVLLKDKTVPRLDSETDAAYLKRQTRIWSERLALYACSDYFCNESSVADITTHMRATLEKSLGDIADNDPQVENIIKLAWLEFNTLEYNDALRILADRHMAAVPGIEANAQQFGVQFIWDAWQEYYRGGHKKAWNARQNPKLNYTQINTAAAAVAEAGLLHANTDSFDTVYTYLSQAKLPTASYTNPISQDHTMENVLAKLYAADPALKEYVGTRVFGDIWPNVDEQSYEIMTPSTYAMMVRLSVDAAVEFLSLYGMERMQRQAESALQGEWLATIDLIAPDFATTCESEDDVVKDFVDCYIPQIAVAVLAEDIDYTDRSSLIDVITTITQGSHVPGLSLNQEILDEIEKMIGYCIGNVESTIEWVVDVKDAYGLDEYVEESLAAVKKHNHIV